MFLCVPYVYVGIIKRFVQGHYNQKEDAAVPEKQRGEISQTARAYAPGWCFFLPFYTEANCKQWAVTLPDSPEDVL